MEIKELMNGAVLTYIMQNLQSTATKFFLSSFTNRYIKNPVYEDHYSTFSDVLHDFWVNLPKLVSSLLDNYTEQLKVEAAFLADDSVEQIQFHLKGVLESWIDTYLRFDVSSASRVSRAVLGAIARSQVENLLREGS